MTNPNRLAAALDGIAASLQSNPSSVIGLKSIAVGDGKGGTVIGTKVVAVGGPGSGNVTGMKVSVTAGTPNSDDQRLIQELRDAAAAVRTGSAPKSWVDGLIDRTKTLGNKALEAAISAAVSAAIEHYATK